MLLSVNSLLVFVFIYKEIPLFLSRKMTNFNYEKHNLYVRI